MRLIDAEALVPENLFKICGLTEMEYVEGYSMGQIYRAPTIDAAPIVHGEWLRPIVGRDPLRICKICEGEAWRETNYCPHCGAKMEVN